MAKIQIKNSFITSSADITISSSMVKFSSGISAKNITGSFSGSIPALTSYYKQGGNSFGTTAILGTNDNQALTFETNASEKVRITTSGSVGIGTTSPAAKLTVSTSDAQSHLRIIYSPASTYYTDYDTNRINFNGSNQNFAIRDNSTDVFYIKSGGNIGIGTTSPSNKLTVVTSTQYDGYYLRNSNGVVATMLGVGATNDDGTIGLYSSVVLKTSITANGVSYFNGGSVGIGTSSPGTKLTIVDASPTVRLQDTNTSVAGGVYGTIDWLSSDSSMPGGLAAKIDVLDDGGSFGDRGAIRFFTNNATSLGERVRISSTGNVGIGTTNPTQRLDLSGSLRIRSSGTYSDPTDNAGFINYDSQGGLFTISARSNGGSTYMAFRTSNSGTGGERMRIINDGNVGIGTSSPSEILDVYRANTGGWNPRIVARDGTNAAFIGSYSGKPGVFAHNNALSAWADLYLNTVDATTLNSGKVFIGGNVGIGTTSPLARLHVSGSSTSLSAIFNGCVGIGTTSPVAKLSVYTTSPHGSPTGISVAAGAGGANLLARDSGNYHNWFPYTDGFNYYSADSHVFRSSNHLTNYVYINSNGNVGIGTTSPAYRLQLGNTTPSSTATPETINLGGTYSNSAGSNVKLRVYDDGAGSVAGMNVSFGQAEVNTWSTGKIAFYRGTTQTAIIDANGNVGIGTSSPLAKLQVSAGRSYFFSGDQYSVGLAQTAAQANYMYLGTATDGTFYISETGGTARVTVQQSGNVGIGTTSPGAKLDIAGASANGIIMRFDTTTNYNAWIRPYWNSSTDSRIDFAINRAAGVTPDVILSVGYGSNVGIGTTSPDAKLRVIGNVRATSFTGSFSGSVVGSNMFVQGGNSFGTTAILGTNDSQVLTFKTNNSEKVRIDTNGNVGIGTSTPNAFGGLHVYKANSGGLGGYAILDNNGLAVANETALLFSDGGASFTRAAISSTTEDSPYYGDIKFKTGASVYSSLNTRMIIKGNGNVGIGTTSPICKLNVTSSASTLAASFQGNVGVGNTAGYYYGLCSLVKPTSGLNLNIMYASLSSGYGEILMSNYNDNTGASGWASYIRSYSNPGSDYSSILTFGTSPASLGGPSERMRITATGNVGIGTSTASGLLSLHGTYPQIIANNPTTGSGVVIQLRDNGRDAGFMGHSTTTARLQFGSKGSSAAHMTISETGDVGIGTTAPTAQSNYRFLQVNGTNSAIIETMVGGTRIGGFDSSATALYVGSIGSYPIVFRTAVNEKMRLDTNGNLGIGTSSPATLLHVDTSGADARIRVSAGTNTVQGGMIANSGTSLIYAGSITNHGFSLRTNDTDRVRIDTSGNVGIGTTSPASKLEVKGVDDATITAIFQSTAGGNAAYNGGIQLGNAASSQNSQIYHDSSGDNTLTFKSNYASGTGNKFVFAPGGTERVRFQQNGNVGIGTSSPATILQVVGTGLGSVGTINIKGSQAHLGFTTAGGTFKGWTGYFNSVVHGSDLDLNIKTGYAGASNIRMGTIGDTTQVFISGSGNVGIGTTSPASLLQVGGSSGATATPTAITFDNTYRNGVGGNTSLKIYLYKSGGETYGFGLNNAAGIEYHAGSSGGSTAYHAFYTETTEKLRITSVGNVGIGTSSPTAKLHLTTVGGDGTPALRILASASDTFNWASSTMYANLAAAETAIHLIGKAQSQYNSAYLGYRHVSDTSASNMLSLGLYAADHLVNILGSGNVGIGTTSPAYKLDVNGAIGVGGLRFLDLSTNYFRIFEPAGNIAIYLGNAADPANYYDNTTHFFRNRGGSSNYAVIEGNGNLGIGTSSVTEAIHVYRAANSIIRLQAGGGNVSGVRMDDASSSGYLLKNRSSDTTNNALAGALYTYTDSNKAFQHIHNGTPLFTILSGGSVGIGTSAPSQKLDVSGIIKSGVAGNSSANYASLLVTSAGEATTQAGIGIQQATTEGDTIIFCDYEPYVEYNFMHENSTNQFMIHGGGSTNNLGSNTFYNRSGNARTGYIKHVFNQDNGNMFVGGSVGIGTTGPLTKLHVAGTTGLYQSANSTYLYYDHTGVNTWRTGIFTDNTSTYIIGHDTGGTFATKILAITMGGNVGIGTTSPSSRLQLGNLTSTSTATPETLSLGGTFSNSAGSNIKLKVYDDGAAAGGMSVSAGQMEVNTWSSGKIAFYRGTTQTAIIDANGDVGIANSSPLGGVSSGLTIGGIGSVKCFNIGMQNTYGRIRERDQIDALAITTNINDSGTQDSSTRSSWKLRMGWGNGQDNFLISRSPVASNTFADLFYIKSDGNVGVGTTAPLSKLNSYASGSNLSVFRVDGGNGTLFEVTDQLSGSLFSVNDVSGLPLLEVFSNNRIVAGKYGSNALVISGSSVGIGTTTPAYKLQVNGSFGATTKSFVIDHPTKEGKKLVYGSLESPYHGIRLTGRNMLIDGECKVQLPDYIYKLARPESVNIQITPIKCGKVIYVDEISVENNYFVVKYDKSLLESYKNYEFFWDFTATRSDVEQLVVEQ